MKKYLRKYENLIHDNENNENSINLMDYINENNNTISPIQHMCGIYPIYPISGYPMECMYIQNTDFFPINNSTSMYNTNINPIPSYPNNSLNEIYYMNSFEDNNYNHDEYIDLD